MIGAYEDGARINYTADFRGLEFKGDDLVIKSTSTDPRWDYFRLEICQAHGKLIDFAAKGTSFAYAYMATGGEKIDGSNFSQLEVIIGGNNTSNEILTGSGGSSLWGGVGGNDTLIGGSGEDNFFYGKNDGKDVINNSTSNDSINLYDVRLSDITSVSYGLNSISVNLNSGGSLKINDTGNLSSKFILADGTKWQFNHSNSQWQNA